MKPVLRKLVSENGDYIFVLSKDISDIKSDYELQKEIDKFCDKEIKVFEKSIEFRVEMLLRSEGIELYDQTKKSVESALNVLREKCKKAIIIDDAYKDYKINVVKRRKGQTIILEDGELSVANEVKIRRVL